MSNNKLFTTVAMKRPKQSTFDLTHDVKMSGKMGMLMPCLALDVLPGDSFKIGADALLRFAPILAPIMHRVDLSIHYFFVPNRILWDNWEKFITGTPDDNGDAYVPPYLEISGSTPLQIQKLMDYFGITPPPNISAPIEQVSALPFAAYNKIYNEYYRDQNLIDEVFTELVDGGNDENNFTLYQRAWEHDYFTSCLPFAQKGAAVDLPLGDVVLAEDWQDLSVNPVFLNKMDGELSPSGPLNQGGFPEPNIYTTDISDSAVYNPNGSLVVGSTTINDLRRAYRLQEWLEKNARGGTRYTEAIMVHFGVKSPDARLQRPEYITGVKAPVIINEVLNTTGPLKFYDTENNTINDMGSPVGDMSGHATAVTQGRIGRYYAQEHGWIIGIVSIMPKTAYQQGIHRMFTRKEFTDYAFPTFANIGEQEVALREIYAYTPNGDNLFGYIPRYAEYKFMNSRVAGDFRNQLDFWHLGRKFATPPALNQAFIECSPTNVERIFAVATSLDNMWMHILHKIKVKRKLPFFGTPTI